MVPGEFQVLLNASDAAGNWDSDTLVVTILDRLPPEAVPGPNQVVRAGSVVIFNGSESWDSSGKINHTWTFTYDGRTVGLDGDVQSFQFMVPGTYVVTLTTTDFAGNLASSDITVTVLSNMAEPEEAWDDDNGWFLIVMALGLFTVNGLSTFRNRQRRKAS